jgi:hypothetical protein
MSTSSKQAVLTNLLLIATCRLQAPNLKKATEYATGLVYIRGLQQTLPPGTSRQAWACKSGSRQSPLNGKPFPQELSATSLVDAQDFFADFWPPNYWSPHASQNSNANVVPWENLRRLTLTSHLLHPTKKSVMIRKLLTAAGRAAAFMPKLEVLEIWTATFTYGGKDPANRWEGLLVSSNTCTSAKSRRLPLQAIGSGRTCRTRWGIVWNTAGRIYRGMDLALSLRLLLRDFRGGRAGLSTIVLR